MNIEILKQRDTPLLSRKRVTVMATYEGSTPSRKKLREAIAKKMDVDEELTIVKHIYPGFGATRAKVIAHIYSNEADKKKIEDAYLLKKHTAEKPKEEAAPAAPASPAPEAPPEPASTPEAPASE
ncbi:MAG: hypothetical protein KJ574_04785 [Nanoarchaeota archaeon]|nr:hypothetical protein [Nanoarchaeota archaeon]